MTNGLESRYRLLLTRFLDGPRGEVWSQRLGAPAKDALSVLIYSLTHDLALPPAELDRQHVEALVSTLLPGRLTGKEAYASSMVDLLDDFLVHVADSEGLTTHWEWTSAVDDARARFDQQLANPDRPTPASPRHRPDRRAAPRIGRNDPCPCGSGRKYKVCCLRLSDS